MAQHHPARPEPAAPAGSAAQAGPPGPVPQEGPAAPAAPAPAGPVGPVPVGSVAPASSGGLERPAAGRIPVRASDAEREAAVERLRIASVEGRLTFAELSERTGAAYAAVTRDELDLITADLPDCRAEPEAIIAPLRQERFTAILGDVREHVAGRVDRELVALSVLGDTVLDLRDAHVPSGEVFIVATAVLGDIKIIVPAGVEVRLSGFAILGDRKVQIGTGPAGRTSPVVHVRAHAVLGDVKIVDEEHQGALRRAFANWRNGGSGGGTTGITGSGGIAGRGDKGGRTR